MTEPGVNVIVAATFLAAVGDIGRFASSQARRLPRPGSQGPPARESAAKRGHISKQGSATGRHALVEASWSAVRQPGPPRAFYQRVRARRGHQIAIVAAARKLACLFGACSPRGEDYAYGQPSLTRKKMRRLEITAGAPRYQGKTGIWSTNKKRRRPSARSPSRQSWPTRTPCATGPRAHP